MKYRKAKMKRAVYFIATLSLAYFCSHTMHAGFSWKNPAPDKNLSTLADQNAIAKAAASGFGTQQAISSATQTAPKIPTTVDKISLSGFGAPQAVSNANAQAWTRAPAPTDQKTTSSPVKSTMNNIIGLFKKSPPTSTTPAPVPDKIVAIDQNTPIQVRVDGKLMSRNEANQVMTQKFMQEIDPDFKLETLSPDAQQQAIKEFVGFQNENNALKEALKKKLSTIKQADDDMKQAAQNITPKFDETPTVESAPPAKLPPEGIPAPPVRPSQDAILKRLGKPDDLPPAASTFLPPPSRPYTRPVVPTAELASQTNLPAQAETLPQGGLQDASRQDNPVIANEAQPAPAFLPPAPSIPREIPTNKIPPRRPAFLTPPSPATD
jgi:hypothetical protein